MAFFKLTNPMNSKKIMVMLTWLKVSKKPSKKWLYNNRVKARIFRNKSKSLKKRATSRLHPRRTPIKKPQKLM
jgi:hypothetical protein